jgi:NAD(P)-dependent dehydrogenase (short-subunit alcohol dehydrogenase family)
MQKSAKPFIKLTGFLMRGLRWEGACSVPLLLASPPASGLAPRLLGTCELTSSDHENVEEMWRVRDRQVPMGFGGEAWDVAWAAVYLASDESRYVTGIELVVDGGLTLKCV